MAGTGVVDQGSPLATAAAVAAVGALAAAVDACLAVSLDGLSRDELLGLVSGVEVQVRRLPVLDHALVAALEARGVAAELGACSTSVLLSQLLRISPGEAGGRVRAAADLGPRQTLAGQSLPPLFPVVAAGQAAGSISPAHAAIITSTVNALPVAVPAGAEVGVAVERLLVQQALEVHPARLGQLARRVLDTLDPDGVLADEAHHARRRELTLTGRRDGSGVLTGYLTPSALAVWRTILDTLAAPHHPQAPEPADTAPGAGEAGPDEPVSAETTGPGPGTGAGGGPEMDGDRRSPGQRRHDALLDAGLRILRSGSLPDCGGVPVTILATINATHLARDLTNPAAAAGTGTGIPASRTSRTSRTGRDAGRPGGRDGDRRRGFAVTGHGELISLAELLTLAAEADLIPVTCTDQSGILSYGRTRRLATPRQRLALAARDHGCSFPGCTRPPAWTQAHHIHDWANGGPTDLANLTLLCGHHHRALTHNGWHCRMINGHPHWIPPTWLDPTQTPRHNTAHHTDIRFPATSTPPAGSTGPPSTAPTAGAPPTDPAPP